MRSARKPLVVDFKDRIWHLLATEPFYSEISLIVNKIEDNKIPTLAVGLNEEGEFVMFYNPNFMRQLSDKQNLGVLRHEFDHILFGHLDPRRVPTEASGITQEEFEKMSIADKKEKAKYFQLWNIAVDLSVNSYIDDAYLPFGTIVDGHPFHCFKPGHGSFEKVEEKLSAEMYYTYIRNLPESEQNKLAGLGLFDQHIINEFKKGNITDSEAKAMYELAEERLKEAIKKAAKKAEEANSWGSLPQEMAEELKKLYKNKINWERVLEYFMATSIKEDSKSTFFRLNRKQPYSFPGKKYTRKSNILIAIDQSGSVSDNLISKFFGALSALAELQSFDVIFFDTQVYPDKMFTWEKGEDVPATREATGGTDFQPVVDFAENELYDALMICTDMECYEPGRSPIPRLWIAEESDIERCNWVQDSGDFIARVPPLEE